MFDFENLSLEERIKYFINQRKETEYWDFKQKWSGKKKIIQNELKKFEKDEKTASLSQEQKLKKAESNAGKLAKEEFKDLIKDIVCFSNTVHDRDCYLIFGVSNDYEIIGIGDDERLERARIEDVFSDMVFANGVRPEIDIDSVILDGKELQVITIRNEKRTPIYLEKEYGAMKPGCIYTRHGDRNTPNHSNASPNEIEMLWKKRFNLLRTSLDFVFDSLNKEDEWIESEGDFYNSFNPAYNIKVDRHSEDEINRKAEFYHFGMTNSAYSYEELNICYNEIKLDSYLMTWLDSGRLRIPVPENGFIDGVASETWGTNYRYFIENSKRYKLLKFIYDPTNSDQYWAMENLKDIILFYRSESERKSFEHWLSIFPNQIKVRIEENKKSFHISCSNKLEEKVDLHQLALGKTLNSYLQEFRNLDQYSEFLEDAEYL